VKPDEAREREREREGLAESHLSLGFHVSRRSPGDCCYSRSPSCAYDEDFA
jgi:hypothetical protein